MRALSKIELSDDLRRLGLEKGDVVMVHTSLKEIGYTLISIPLPLILVLMSLDNNFELEPVMYKSELKSVFIPLTTSSNSLTICISSIKI